MWVWQRNEVAKEELWWFLTLLSPITAQPQHGSGSATSTCFTVFQMENVKGLGK